MQTTRRIQINTTCSSIREVLFAFFNGGSARRNDCKTFKNKLTTFRLKAIIVKASCSHWVPSGCHSGHGGRRDWGRCRAAPSIHCTRLALVTLRMMEVDTGGGWSGDGERIMDALSDRSQIHAISLIMRKRIFSSQVNLSYFDTHLPQLSLFVENNVTLLLKNTHSPPDVGKITFFVKPFHH